MHEAVKLVRKQELLRYLLAKYTLKECSALMQVSYSTLRKWANNADFLAELKELSGEVWQEVTTELKVLTTSVQERLVEESEKALNTLIELMEDRTQKGIVRAKAAESILDRNPDTSKTSKISGAMQHSLKVDPMMLLHAAATANEVEEFKARVKAKELT